MIAVDSSGIAGSAGEVFPQSSGVADVEMETTPATPGSATTVKISLWQRNLRALRLKRRFAIHRVRESAVRKLAGITWNDPA